jgi:hypothetical protein
LCPCGKNYCLKTRGLKIEQPPNKKTNPKQLQKDDMHYGFIKAYIWRKNEA